MEKKQTSGGFANAAISGLKQTMTTKRAGFYVGAVSAVAAIIQGALYGAYYSQTGFYDKTAVVLSIVGGVLFLLLSLTHYSSPFAPVVLWATNFASLLLFINAIYMYLSDVFYGGVNATTIAALSTEFVVCMLLFLLSTIIANVAVYLRQNAKPQAAEGVTNEEI